MHHGAPRRGCIQFTGRTNVHHYGDVPEKRRENVRGVDVSKSPSFAARFPRRLDLDYGKASQSDAGIAADSMSNTVTATVGHRLGKVEAVRRLKEGIARANGNLGLVAIEQETWEGDTLRFRMRALGQTAASSIEVLEEAIRIEVSLPWLLAKVAERLLPAVCKEATALLEKK
jgi:hypothetical protein